MFPLSLVPIPEILRFWSRIWKVMVKFAGGQAVYHLPRADGQLRAEQLRPERESSLLTIY